MKEQCRRWNSPLPDRNLQKTITQISAMVESLDKMAKAAGEKRVRLRYNLYEDHYEVTWLAKEDSYPTFEQVRRKSLWCFRNVWVQWTVGFFLRYRDWEVAGLTFWKIWELKYGKYKSRQAEELFPKSSSTPRLPFRDWKKVVSGSEQDGSEAPSASDS